MSAHVTVISVRETSITGNSPEAAARYIDDCYHVYQNSATNWPRSRVVGHREERGH
jgi:hypothetical protein